jgi:hypothetical protein
MLLILTYLRRAGANGLFRAIQLDKIRSLAHIRRRGSSLHNARISSPLAVSTTSSISSCAASRRCGLAHVNRLKSAGETPNSRAAAGK